MMKSKILQFVDFTKLALCSNVYDDVKDFAICGFYKTQKSKYLKNKTLFFLQIKNYLITHQDYFMAKDFVGDVTVK